MHIYVHALCVTGRIQANAPSVYRSVMENIYQERKVFTRRIVLYVRSRECVCVCGHSLGVVTCAVINAQRELNVGRRNGVQPSR
jgi:hypothetical protein